MQNIAIVDRGRADAEQLDGSRHRAARHAARALQGTPLTERQWAHGNTLPDKITLFQGPIEDASDDEDDVVVAIGETLIHEIGHYFGLSEEEIEEIEERYWRGERRDDDDRRPGVERAPAAPAAQAVRSALLAPGVGAKVVAAIDAAPRATCFSKSDRARGALTLPLAATGAPILAVEIDRDLVADLAPQVPANVTVLSGDILHDRRRRRSSAASSRSSPRLGESDRGRSGATSCRRARRPGDFGSSAICPTTSRRRSCSGCSSCTAGIGFFADATVMLQREVADRLVARPGTKDYGVLTVLLVAARLGLASPRPAARRLHPAPKVRSTVVRLEFGCAGVRLSDEALFERMVKAMFSSGGRRWPTP